MVEQDKTGGGDDAGPPWVEADAAQRFEPHDEQGVRAFTDSADAAYERSGRTFGRVRVDEGVMILEVEDEPQLETGIGYGKVDALGSRRLYRVSEFRMILWPLNVEDAPAFIDFRGTLVVSGQLDQRGRGALLRMDSQVERGVPSDVR